jgi:hypothetical protein
VRTLSSVARSFELDSNEEGDKLPRMLWLEELLLANVLYKDIAALQEYFDTKELAVCKRVSSLYNLLHGTSVLELDHESG